MIRDSINGFGVDDDFIENNKIWDIFPDFNITIMQRISGLLGKRNVLVVEFHGKSLLIRLFMESVSQ